MRLPSIVALVIFNGLLIGVVATTHAQLRRPLFGPGCRPPKQFIASTATCAGERSCECEVDDTQGDACKQGCTPGGDSIQKAGDRGVAQKSVLQKSVLQKSVLQKSVLQKSVVQKSVVQKSVVQKSVVQKSVVQKDVVQKESGSCESDCRPNPVVRAFAKLDGAVKGLFRCKSNCCDPCGDCCCEPCCDSAYGAGSESYGSPMDLESPSQYDGLEAPLLDRNPFEDDAVQPPPPLPSEARVTPRPLLGSAAAVEVSSPSRVQTPPRLRPSEAAPLRKTPQWAKSTIDRGPLAASRRKDAGQPAHRLTSAQAELSDR